MPVCTLRVDRVEGEFAGIAVNSMKCGLFSGTEWLDELEGRWQTFVWNDRQKPRNADSWWLRFESGFT
jgi:hypothetical protein